MINRKLLLQYADLQKEIKELQKKIEQNEKKISQIEKSGAVCDKVRGGEGGYQFFKIEGFPFPEYSRQKTLLMARKSNLARLESEILESLNEIEEYISGIDDSRMRRIMNLRLIENLSWNQIANQIGGGNTEDSIRKAFNRYINCKKS